MGLILIALTAQVRTVSGVEINAGSQVEKKLRRIGGMPLITAEMQSQLQQRINFAGGLQKIRMRIA